MAGNSKYGWRGMILNLAFILLRSLHNISIHNIVGWQIFFKGAVCILLNMPLKIHRSQWSKSSQGRHSIPYNLIIRLGCIVYISDANLVDSFFSAYITFVVLFLNVNTIRQKHKKKIGLHLLHAWRKSSGFIHFRLPCIWHIVLCTLRNRRMSIYRFTNLGPWDFARFLPER